MHERLYIMSHRSWREKKCLLFLEPGGCFISHSERKKFEYKKNGEKYSVQLSKITAYAKKKPSLYYLKYFAFYFVRLSVLFLYTQTFNPTVLLSITSKPKIVVSYKNTHYNINIIFIHGKVVRGTIQRAR